MKITRYFQSCLLIEDGRVRILIDPSAQEKDKMGKLDELDAVLYTHEHGDHFDAEMAQTFVEQGIAPVYANASTAKLIKASKTVVKDGQEYDINGLKIKALDLPHCLMWDGSQGPQNTGYLVGERLFHSGDGVKLGGLKAEILAVPLNGPDVSMKDAYDFAKQVSAKKVIPVHYDYLGGNPDVFADVGKGLGLDVRVIHHGKSVEL
jgi:L-ascorbate metabolism protein UlaG (beta-lactamase superfamily)